MADSKEAQFQQEIIDAMTADGWLTGPAGGYDAANNPQDPQRALVRAVTRELERGGTLDVLRHGVKAPGVKLGLCSFKPDHGMNPDALARYRANRLRVVPKVSSSPHACSGEYNPRLNLVLFVNGIPTATLELFRKNLQSFVRSYEFLSQIVAFEDRELEHLCVYARALHPLLRTENLEEDTIDVSELELTHYRLNKHVEHQLNLGEEGEDYDGLKPVSDVGSDKPDGPERQRDFALLILRLLTGGTGDQRTVPTRPAQ